MTRKLTTAATTLDPTPLLDEEASRVVVRPDGFYWIADDGRQEFGPFTTATEAMAALREGIEAAPEPGETVAEAEAEIGIADWVDPETGQPAEALATRLEDH